MSNNISFQQALKFGEKCINSCLLINGGAAIALLTFLGTLIDEHYSTSINCIVYALWVYLAGLISAVIAFGFAYFAQIKITWQENLRTKYSNSTP